MGPGAQLGCDLSSSHVIFAPWKRRLVVLCIARIELMSLVTHSCRVGKISPFPIHPAGNCAWRRKSSGDDGPSVAPQSPASFTTCFMFGGTMKCYNLNVTKAGARPPSAFRACKAHRCLHWSWWLTGGHTAPKSGWCRSQLSPLRRLPSLRYLATLLQHKALVTALQGSESHASKASGLLQTTFRAKRNLCGCNWLQQLTTCYDRRESK